MSEKRRGLGRGLGALIPSVPAKGAGDRPVDDVFFRDPTPREAPTATVTLDRPAETATPAVDPADLATLDRPGQVDEVVAFTQPAVGDLPVFVDVPADTVATVTEAEEEPTDPDDDLVPVPGARFAEIPVDAIRPNPRQPRQVFDDEELAELVHSIREIGVLQPIVVRSCPSPDDSPRYELVMGERRWRATQEAGFATIPAIIRDTADDDLLRDALLENLHRSQLNPLEEAAAYQQLLDDFGCTHEQLAGRLGRSRPQISNTIRLLRLPPLVQRRVAAGVLSAGHARALLGLEDGSSMEALAQRIVSEGLSVRAVEEIVSMGDAPSRAVKRAPRAGGQHSELDDLAGRLGDRLDTRVAIALGRRKGKLSIDFASVEDLNRILGLMAPDLRGLFASE